MNQLPKHVMITREQLKRTKCPRCGIDPRPREGIGGVIYIPCGMIEDDHLRVVNMDIAGCPMTEWQSGYSKCLMDKKNEPVR